MTDRKLLNSLSKLGFPMFEPSEEMDVNETLAEVVKSYDARLWEGFPVLLANAADNYEFAPERVEQEYYSRTVKKKVVALANSELHSLSRKLLER